MSTTASPLPEETVAYQNLFAGVDQRVFFAKLAQIRPEYYPTTEKQAQRLIEIGEQLDAIDEEEAVKAASVGGVDPFDAAAAALGGVIKQAGYAYPGVRQDQEERVAAKQAADAFASDPTIYNSVLALKLAQAERVKQQLGV